jgi:hypothetical protein
VDGLSVFKGNDSERTVLCFCHKPPQGIASVRLLALFQGVGDHPLDPVGASASGQAAIQLLVLDEDPFGGDIKIRAGLGHQISDGGGGQLGIRHLEPRGSIREGKGKGKRA